MYGISVFSFESWNHSDLLSLPDFCSSWTRVALHLTLSLSFSVLASVRSPPGPHWPTRSTTHYFPQTPPPPQKNPKTNSCSVRTPSRVLCLSVRSLTNLHTLSHTHHIHSFIHSYFSSLISRSFVVCFTLSPTLPFSTNFGLRVSHSFLPCAQDLIDQYYQGNNTAILFGFSSTITFIISLRSKESIVGLSPLLPV